MNDIDERGSISDYWRLPVELTVKEAALLIIGCDPSDYEYVHEWGADKRPRCYDAAIRAVHSALEKKEVQGNLVRISDYDINGNAIGFHEGTIELSRSRVDVASLKEWLRVRGFTNGFFFPKGILSAPDYLDAKNARYAPKLAAAVHAWLAVTDAGKKSPKQALEKWLREHAADFGLTDDDGNPVSSAVEECSKVANWKPGGGAPKSDSA